MAAPSEALLQCLRRLVVAAGPNEASDAALLGRFLAGRDDRAFATLVDRHAELVFQVCWRVLGDVHDAEDAFQATFLVLARKAAAVRPPEALPAWLHGVARRVALKARSARGRQPHTGTPLAAPPVDPRPDPLARLSARELLAIVDEEVRHLAEAYRLPVILCCLEGRSQEEAARLLGWTPGSVKGRLERGRARLHQRLVRRGLTLAAALTAAEASRAAASALVVARLVAPTARGALAFAARQPQGAGCASAAATALARDVLRGPALVKLGAAVALALATSLLAAGLLTYRALNAPSQAPGAAPPAAFAGQRAAAPEEAADARVEVSGRVLGPEGRPVAGARLYVGYAPRRSEPDAVAHRPAYPLRATSGKDGRFRFAFARSELDERYLDACRPVVVAVADGLGLDWAELGEPGPLRFRLVEDLPLEGRILGPDRRPVAGAAVMVREVSCVPAEGPQQRTRDRGKTCRGPLPGLPPRVTTAADGRFRVPGVGRDRQVTLALEGPAISPTFFVATTRLPAALAAPGAGGTPLEYVTAAPRSVRGIVRDRLTGRPVAGVKVSLQLTGLATLTDSDGRYELLGLPVAGESVVAQPQSGQPYFAATMRLPDTPGPGPLGADFELTRGTPLRGRVTDQTTGKPPKRAVVEYYPLASNGYAGRVTVRDRMVPASGAAVGPDGSYSLVVLPGPGIVLVAASPRDSYASAWLDEEELAALCKGPVNHGPGSWAHIADRPVGSAARCVDRYNALALIDPPPGASPPPLAFTLHRARPLRGTVVGPDGEPLAGVRVSGLTSMPDAETLAGASFTVEGLNPHVPRRLSFFHREKQLGKTLTVSGDGAQELTVRLEPCGAVVGRVVDRSGKPVPREVVWFGRLDHGIDARAETDEQGRFRAALVPGLKYPLQAPAARLLPKGLGELEVASGQTTDLGDVSLADWFPGSGASPHLSPRDGGDE
jgi:RNA polymerase sigma factor (sigma-70 family)